MSQVIDIASLLSSTSDGLIVSVEGEEKASKTSWAITAAQSDGPLAIFDYDFGVKRALSGRPELRAMLEKPGTLYFNYSVKIPGGFTKQKPENVISHFRPVLERYLDDFDKFIKSDCRTQIQDTATETWKLIEYVIAGRAEKFPYHLRPEMYAIYRGMLDQVRLAGKNAILIHKVKPEWKDDKPTGGMKRDGFPEAQYAADAFFRLRSETVPQADLTPEKPGRVKFYLDVIKSGYRPMMLNGTTWEGMDWEAMKGVMLG